MDSFTLEGVRYYQQYRRCGKASCKTCSNGPGHGPYWYGRDKRTGKRFYIGRELPENITRAHEAKATLIIRMQLSTAYNEILAAKKALSKFMNEEALTKTEKKRLSRMGFGNCLVSDGDHDYEDIPDNLPVDQLLTLLGAEKLPGI